MKLAVLLASTTALARPLHGSVGLGGSLLATGAEGAASRLELELDVEPSRFGAVLALRGFASGHRGLACAGLVYEAGAARPRLVLALHADLGVDLDHRAPLVGGGVRATLGLFGPIGLAGDAGSYLVLDGIDRSRLVLLVSGSMVVRW
ncbi:hypothetical protein BH11MYX1_BH11MYX1_35160 [soil metagenome]